MVILLDGFANDVGRVCLTGEDALDH